jgi:DNA-binding PadR family transcriptional regulator
MEHNYEHHHAKHFWKHFGPPWMRDPSCWEPPFAPRKWFRERGDLRFYILLVLKDKPLHGYGTMKAIGEKFDYSPSPGVIYPNLQMLEDQGYVKVTEENGKKVYAITDEGKKYLEENEETLNRIEDKMSYKEKAESFTFRKDFGEMAFVIFSNQEFINQEKRQRISQVIKDAKGKIREIIFG